MAKKEDSEYPEDSVEVHRLLESIRFRAGAEQFNFLNLTAKNTQLFILTALLLNGSSVIMLNASIYNNRFYVYYAYESFLFYIVLPLSLFFLGIIFATCSFYFNYLNNRYCMDMISCMWNKETHHMKEKYQELECSSSLLPETRKFHKIMRKNKNEPNAVLKKLSRLINRTAIKGRISLYLSYIFFIFGHIVIGVILSYSRIDKWHWNL